MNRAYRDPVATDVPVLMLSGTIDPVTPPRSAEEAMVKMSNALHVTLEGGGHGSADLPGSTECVMGMLRTFVDRLLVAEVDTSCLDTISSPLFEPS